MRQPLWRDGDQVTQADFDSMREDREKLSARVAKLEKYFRRFGSHDDDCISNLFVGLNRCDCGYSDALETMSDPQENP